MFVNRQLVRNAIKRCQEREVRSLSLECELSYLKCVTGFITDHKVS